MEEGPTGPNRPAYLTQNVRQTQIVTAALAMSCLAAGTIFTTILRPQNNNNLPLTISSAVIGGVLVVMRLLVPSMIVAAVRNNLRKTLEATELDREQLARTYFSSAIVAAALLEGGVMLNLVAYHVTGHIGNAVAAALLFLGVPLLVPSTNQVEDWIDSQLRLARE